MVLDKLKLEDKSDTKGFILENAILNSIPDLMFHFDLKNDSDFKVESQVLGSKRVFTVEFIHACLSNSNYLRGKLPDVLKKTEFFKLLFVRILNLT